METGEKKKKKSKKSSATEEPLIAIEVPVPAKSPSPERTKVVELVAEVPLKKSKKSSKGTEKVKSSKKAPKAPVIVTFPDRSDVELVLDDNIAVVSSLIRHICELFFLVLSSNADQLSRVHPC